MMLSHNSENVSHCFLSTLLVYHTQVKPLMRIALDVSTLWAATIVPERAPAKTPIYTNQTIRI